MQLHSVLFQEKDLDILYKSPLNIYSLCLQFNIFLQNSQQKFQLVNNITTTLNNVRLTKCCANGIIETNNMALFPIKPSEDYSHTKKPLKFAVFQYKNEGRGYKDEKNFKCYNKRNNSA